MLIEDRPGFTRASLFNAGWQFKDACVFSPVVVGPLQHARPHGHLHVHPHRHLGHLVALLIPLLFNVPSQKWTLSPRFCPTLSTL